MTAEKNSIFKSYILFWQNAFDFKGRTRRNDFWNVIIINWVIQIFLLFFNMTNNDSVKLFTAIFLIIYQILCIIPQFALLVRRLHDVGKSTIFAFISLIPIAGQIIVLINLLKDSQREANEFGESPKYIVNQTDESENKTMYCPICKYPISNNDSVCPKCGSKINVEEIYGQL